MVDRPAVRSSCSSSSTAAAKLFDLKWPRVQRALSHQLRCQSVPTRAQADLIQDAATFLWQQCRRMAGSATEISATIIALKTVDRWWRVRQRRRLEVQPGSDTPDFADALDANPAPEAAVVVDGVRLTISDARLDHGDALDVLTAGVDTTTVMRRLGVSRQRVYQLCHQLGGRQIGRRWVFPANAGLP